MSYDRRDDDRDYDRGRGGGGYGGGGGYDSRPPPTRLFIGNLPPDIRSHELDDIFGRFGRIRSVDIRGGAGRPFAFVEYYDERDAEDAIYYRDGWEFAGGRLRVERTKRGPMGAGGGGGAPPPAARYGGRHSDHRVIVMNIPKGGSWQDLKDFCRTKGLTDVLFADVKNDEGVVEFGTASDAEKAVRELDGATFVTRFNEEGTVSVRLDGDGARKSRSRSRSPRRSRSPPRRSRSRSRSPAARRSRSRSRSPPPRRGGSRSRSRSPAARRSPSRSRSRSRSRSPGRKD